MNPTTLKIDVTSLSESDRLLLTGLIVQQASRFAFNQASFLAVEPSELCIGFAQSAQPAAAATQIENDLAQTVQDLQRTNEQLTVSLKLASERAEYQLAKANQLQVDLLRESEELAKVRCRQNELLAEVRQLREQLAKVRSPSALKSESF